MTDQTQTAQITNIDKAKRLLTQKSPFYAVTQAQLTQKLTAAVPTAAVDYNNTLYINPDFFAPLPVEEVAGVIAHECLHVLREDPAVMKSLRTDAERHVWNVAADLVMNDLIERHEPALRLPKEALRLTDHWLKELAEKHDWDLSRWENAQTPTKEIHRALMAAREQMEKEQKGESDGQKQEDTGQDSGGDPALGSGGSGGDGGEQGAAGEGRPEQAQPEQNPQPDYSNHPLMGGDPLDIIPAESASDGAEDAKPLTPDQIKRIANIAAQAAQRMREAGNLPGYLQDFIAELNAPAVDWRAVLREFLTSRARQDYQWHRPHSSILTTTGCIAPSIQPAPGLGDIIVLLDSSGSVSDDLLAQFWSELAAMQRELGATLHIGHFTTGLNTIDTRDPQDTITPATIRERFNGGTDIPQAMRELRQKIDTGDIPLENPAQTPLIVLSDFYSPVPGEADWLPGAPVLWAHTPDHGDLPDWGQVVEISND